MKQLSEKPEAIVINFPQVFIKQYTEEVIIRTFSNPELLWYSFITTIPKHDVITCYVAWGGFIRYKCKVVEFLKNKTVDLPGYSYEIPRNWVVITSPEKAPEEFPFRGGQGFRYSKELF